MIDCTFGGKACLLTGTNEFALEPGVAPSSGQVTLYETDAKALQRQNTAHTLQFTDDDGQTLKFTGLYIQRIEGASVANAGGQGGGGAGQIAGPSDANTVRVYFADVRALWQFPSVTGQFNVLMDDGIAYVTNTTASGQTPHTWKQLVAKCWTALGATAPNPPRTPTWTPQNVRWEFANAGQALQSLLEPVQLDVALKPDGTFHYIDLQDTTPYIPKGLVLGHVVTPRDVAHRTPQTVRVAYRVLREKPVIGEAVIRHDGLTGASQGSDSSAAEGEWITIGAAATAWNFPLPALLNDFYMLGNSKVRPAWVARLGGGAVGAARLERLQSQAYRCFRVSDSDRDKILPLVPIRATVQTTAGRAVYMGAKPHSGTRFHARRADNGGVLNYIGAVAKHDLFQEFTGTPGVPVHIVDAKEGVVEFKLPAGLALTGIRKKAAANMLPQHFALDPDTVRFVVGFFRKFSSDPEADYHLVTQTVAGKTNGQTQTFLSPKAFLREVYNSSSADYTAQNQTELETSATNFLTDYIQSFQQPNPEEYRVSGIDGQTTLTGAVRGIHWTLTRGDGLVTTLKEFSPHAARPVGQPPRQRGRSFTLQANAATLWTEGNLAGAGGSGNLDLGSLDNNAPLLKDHGTGERTDYADQHAFPPWVNDEAGLVLIAEDWGMGVSKKKYGGGSPGTTTTSGGGPVTRFTVGTVAGTPQASG